MRYFKILCVVLFASFLVACHEISSGTVVDKYIDEPHTTFIHVTTGKSTVLVPILSVASCGVSKLKTLQIGLKRVLL